MTYCVAMRVKTGMVFLADSRTNAGVDHIATFRKMHIFEQTGERVLVLMSAGNLATTQSVVSLLRQRSHSDMPNMLNCLSLYEGAEIVGATIREVIQRDGGQSQSAVDFGCSFILGGQIRGEDTRLFNVYSEGNFIEATEDTPYFQIGELKYGKPIIDRAIDYRSSLEQATKCALISMDSTIRSNLSVGLPLDLLRYTADSLDASHHFDITEQHPGFKSLRESWARGLKRTFTRLPDFEW